MVHTIDIFMDALQQVVDQFHFDAYIHPVVPVLNETRALVIQYNKILRAQALESKLCKYVSSYMAPVISSRMALCSNGSWLHL